MKTLRISDDSHRKLPPELLAEIENFIEENKHLGLNLAQNCKMIYEPEQFPGGILRMDEFGMAVIAGVKNSKDITEIVRKVEDVVEKHCQ